MAVQRQKFTRPIPPRRGAVMNHIIGPFQGMNTSVPPQNLQPGETPYSENFVINAGVLESRSGVTHYSDSSVPSWATTGTQPQFRAFMRGSALNNTRWDILLASWSNETVLGAYSTNTGATWVNDSSTLSLIYPTTAGFGNFDWTQFYDPASTENAIAATSNSTLPIYRPLKAASTWTHFSDFVSHESYAKYVESFDNRLIFFNTTQGTTNYGNRVRWSVRGDPTDFTSVGAGFEDLIDMKGSGTGIEVEEDRLVLFSESEVWQGRPRRDAYAFDFEVLEKDKGAPYPNTIVRTPIGIIWLGRDFNFYRVQGGTVRVFTPDVQRYLKGIITADNASTLKAQYDSDEGLYMLFFVRDGDSVTYQYGLFMRVRDVRPNRDGTKDKGDWMLQNLIGSGGSPTGVRGYDNVFPTLAYNYLLPSVYELSQDWHFDTEQSPQGMVQLWTSPAVRGSKDPSLFESVSDLLVDYSYEAASSASTLRMRFLERNSQATGWNVGSTKSVDFEGTPDLFWDKSIWGGADNQRGAAKFPTIKTAHIPMTPEATRYSQFMMYNPGSYSNLTTADAGKSNPEAKLRIHNIHATIRPWSGRRPY